MMIFSASGSRPLTKLWPQSQYSHRAVQCTAVHCTAVQCSAVQISTVQCSAAVWTGAKAASAQAPAVHYLLLWQNWMDPGNSRTWLAVLAPFLPGVPAPHKKAPPGGRICRVKAKTNIQRHPTCGLSCLLSSYLVLSSFYLKSHHTNINQFIIQWSSKIFSWYQRVFPSLHLKFFTSFRV